MLSHLLSFIKNLTGIKMVLSHIKIFRKQLGVRSIQVKNYILGKISQKC